MTDGYLYYQGNSIVGSGNVPVFFHTNSKADIFVNQILNIGANPAQPVIAFQNMSNQSNINVTVYELISGNGLQGLVNVMGAGTTYNGNVRIVARKIFAPVGSILYFGAATVANIADCSFTLICPEMIDNGVYNPPVYQAGIQIEGGLATNLAFKSNLRIEGNLITTSTGKRGFITFAINTNFYVDYIGTITSASAAIQITGGGSNYNFDGTFTGDNQLIGPPGPFAAVFLENPGLGTSTYWITFNGFIHALSLNQDVILLPDANPGPVLRFKVVQLKAEDPAVFSVSSPIVTNTYKVVGVLASNVAQNNISNEYLGITPDFVNPGIAR